MAQVSPAPPDHPQSTSHPFTGRVITCGLCPACKGRRALRSLWGLRVERGEGGSLPSCRRSKGVSQGDTCREHAALFGAGGGDTWGREGEEMRSPGDRAGESTHLPSSTPPFLHGSGWSPSRACRTSGDFPSPSFHLSIHSPRRSSCALL